MQRDQPSPPHQASRWLPSSTQLALHISPPSSTFVLLMQPQNTLIWQDPPLLRPCRNLTSYRKLKSLPTCDSPKNKKSKGSDPELKLLSCSAEKTFGNVCWVVCYWSHQIHTYPKQSVAMCFFFFFDNLADFEHFSRKECCTWRFCWYFVQMKQQQLKKTSHDSSAEVEKKK